MDSGGFEMLSATCGVDQSARGADQSAGCGMMSERLSSRRLESRSVVRAAKVIAGGVVRVREKDAPCHEAT
jgi:hypothetical protein